MPLSRVLQIDAAEHRGELEGGPLEVIRSRSRPAKIPTFQPFDPGITMPSFLWRYTNSVRSIFSESMRRSVPLLSRGTALGNDQLRMPGADPGALPGRQLPQTVKLIFVGPDDQMLPRRRPA
jgi:hypothetical protein